MSSRELDGKRWAQLAREPAVAPPHINVCARFCQNNNGVLS